MTTALSTTTIFTQTHTHADKLTKTEKNFQASQPSDRYAFDDGALVA